jgi:hypothetical protein
MLAAKMEAPIASQPTERPPKKKSCDVSCLRRVKTTTAPNKQKYPTITTQSNGAMIAANIVIASVLSISFIWVK